MTTTGGFAVIVLAAGKSSRMGTTKPLLPLGATTVIERVAASASRAGVADTVVVTGHDSDKLAPVLDRLAVRRAHNPDYESGMFSSVQTGVRALHEDVEAFFILPADYPLVRAGVFDQLVHAFREGQDRILHPTCCGLRGHPPLIPGRYRAELLQANREDNLRSFLDCHRNHEVQVEVEDVTILMDMDTAEDYSRIGRFDRLLDIEKDSSDAHSATLPPEDALYLLSLLEVPDRVVRHCRSVAVVGEALAKALVPKVSSLDVDLVRAACLLHDLARAKPKHAVVAQTILDSLGLTRLGVIVGAHMVLPPEQLSTPLPTEEQLVYLADKLVIEDRIVGLEERATRARCRIGPDPAAAEGVESRMRAARIISERVASILQCPVSEVLPRETPSST
jgi:molybdenum cofactor cytidylyltransferase